ncbi:MAG: pilus assembly protein [Planctomycetaceae bacterium]|nr:pilus assembly protein [Planctomycetaceae bacterium]
MFMRFLNSFLNRSRFRENRRGVSSLEFAIVAPIFICLIVGCVEVSRMCLLRNISQNACYEAARHVIAEGATVQDGIDRANAILSRVGNVSAKITINGADGSRGSDGKVVNELQFDTPSVRARIEIDLRDNAIFLPCWVWGDQQICSEISVRTERYRGYFDGTEIN